MKRVKRMKNVGNMVEREMPVNDCHAFVTRLQVVRDQLLPNKY